MYASVACEPMLKPCNCKEQGKKLEQRSYVGQKKSIFSGKWVGRGTGNRKDVGAANTEQILPSCALRVTCSVFALLRPSCDLFCTCIL